MKHYINTFKLFESDSDFDIVSNIPEIVYGIKLGIFNSTFRVLTASIAWENLDSEGYGKSYHNVYGINYETFIKFSFYKKWPLTGDDTYNNYNDNMMSWITRPDEIPGFIDMYKSDYYGDIDNEVADEITKLVDNFLLETARLHGADILHVITYNEWINVKTGEILPDLKKILT